MSDKEHRRLIRGYGCDAISGWRLIPVVAPLAAVANATGLVISTKHRDCRAFRLTGAVLPCALLLGCFAAHGAEPVFRQMQSTVTPPKTFRRSSLQLTGSATILDLTVNSQTLFTVDAEGKVQSRAAIDAKADVLSRLECEPACANFSPGAKWLAYASSDGLVRLWQRASKRQVDVPMPDGERTVSVKFSHDGVLLACATTTGTVRVWHPESETFVANVTTAPSSVQLLAFSPGNRSLAASPFAGEISVYDLGPSAHTQSMSKRTHTIDVGSRVTALAWIDEERLVAATTEGSIQLVDTKGQEEPVVIARHPCAVWALAFDISKARMAAGSWDGRIRLWETDKWRMLQSLKSHDESVTGVLFDGQDRLVSTGLDGRLQAMLPELPSLGASAVIDGRPDSVWVAIRSQDEKRLFVGGREGRFELWHPETQSLISSQQGHPTTRCAAYSPDGTSLVTGGDDGKIFVCDAVTGEKRRTLAGHPGAISALVFANHGAELVSVCDGKEMKLWDFSTGAELKSWREHEHQIYCAAISPNDKWLITGGGDWTTGDPGELIVWDLRKRTMKSRVEGHKLAVWSIVFTPDGRLFASSDSTGAVKVWDIESLTERRTLQHSTWVRPLAITPDGRTLAVGRGDGSIRLWDTDSWQQVAACVGHKGFSFHLQFDRTGRHLTSSGSEGTVHMWSLAQLRAESASAGEN